MNAHLFRLLAQADEPSSTFLPSMLASAVIVIIIAAAARRRRAGKGPAGLKLSPLSEASPPLKAGMLGKAETECPKEGVARFGDQCFAVVNQGRPIKKGEFVVIREVAGGRVVVLPKPLNSI